MVGLKEPQVYKKEEQMNLSQTIKRIKELSTILRSQTIQDQEKALYEVELHQLIDTLEIPQLIGEFENEYLS